MRVNQKLWQTWSFSCLMIATLFLSSCATNRGMDTDDTTMMSEADRNLPLYHGQAPYSSSFNQAKYFDLMPQTIPDTQRVIVVDPRSFAWGAYDDGKLVKAGIATAGADYCPDDGGPCRTDTGTFRIFAMKGVECVSKTYPRPNGGSLMPYCMFFNKGQSLHGTPDQMMSESNISHGCVHLRIPDAEWLRNNFARIGTKVVIKPY